MQRMVASLLTLCFLMLAGGQSASAQSAAGIHGVLVQESERLRAWAADTRIVAAVRQQNARKVPLAEVKRIDAEWIAGGQPGLKATILGAACSDRIRQLAKDGVHGEIFVTDDQGAIVCANGVTTDYWQGDEPKFTSSFRNGKGTVFIDRPRFDESSGQTIAQISIPINDGETTIGVLVVGVVAGNVARR